LKEERVVHPDYGQPDAPQPLPWVVRQLVLAGVVGLLQQFWVATVAQLLLRSGFVEWFYGPELVALIHETGNDPARMDALTRLGLWASCLAFPFWLLSIAFVLRYVPNAPAELGLTRRHLGRNMLAGVLCWAVLTPLTLGVHVTIRLLYQYAGTGGTSDHPFTSVARNLAPVEWVLLVLTAMVVAPIFEELLFRGILQALFARHARGGVAAMAAAFVVTLWARWGRIAAAFRGSEGNLLVELIPLGFILATVPVFLVVWKFGRSPRAGGVYGTALLFAAVHTSEWPAPIGLFVLALGLGYLAERSRSLAGPIVIHSLFNGVSCVQLILERVQTG
jgi:membrane protease YdiL (CAAX protease family)